MTPQSFKWQLDDILWGTFLAGARLYAKGSSIGYLETRGLLGFRSTQIHKGYLVRCKHLNELPATDLLNLTILGTVCGFLDGGDV